MMNDVPGTSLKEAETLVRNLASPRFAAWHAPLKAVEIDEFYDADGDAMLWVSLIYEGKLKKEHTRDMLALMSAIRRELETHDENRFPVTSFIAEHEIRKRVPA